MAATASGTASTNTLIGRICVGRMTATGVRGKRVVGQAKCDHTGTDRLNPPDPVHTYARFSAAAAVAATWLE